MPRPLSEYTESLRRADPNTSSIFRCPVCLRDIGSNAEAEGQLAKAHIIAEGLGGKAKTLCCRACDSSLGAHVEGPFINWLHALDVTHARKTGGIRAAVLADGVRLPAHMDFDFSLGYMIHLLKPGDADRFASAHGLPLKPGPITSPVPPISLEAYSHSRMTEAFPQIVCLKTAYFSAFELLGYEYVLRPEFEWVRASLRRLETDPRKHHHTRLIRPNSLSIDWREAEVHLIATEGQGQRSILCIYRIAGIPFLTELPPLADSSPHWFETQHLPLRASLAIRMRAPGGILGTQQAHPNEDTTAT